MIITDENLLRVICEPAREDEVPDLIRKLQEALDWSAGQGRSGIGLACPQIGIAKSVAIVRIDNLKIDLVNASIGKGYRKEEFQEGCLSFPGRFETTLRYMEVVVENNLIPPHRFIATELAAVACQHEIDHLNQVLLPDVAIR